ncbi:patatin [Luteitalea sp. TBR-22]|uniref:patatin-like phospholipase family protein n=1 Tax=Luteitalea sp. TBR-22 TaxID=2802971 RepID=UPI001AFB9E17|nr:patatin-like phospholipase family protein [Luteitalea sp. TBR-22]BCS35135.1 patatin [Luteitalea sp. TBR-22]
MTTTFSPRFLAAAALAAAALALGATGASAQELRAAVSSPSDREGVVTPATTAAATQAGRPKVGLALGGGSARGFAHIGVLRWFKEHRIPVDYISGTSMGGLVAGAYASGMEPEEILELMKEVDWDLMFVADSPYKYKTFRRKQDKRSYPSQLEFGLKGGFTLPGGLNPGQQVALLLDRIALAYGDVASFDDLPTPFRCVATDLKNAEAVVLGKGSLAQAMRATMAIPGVFTPVNYENWLLVDGGALNNIPADVTKKMGADKVIAVNVGADSATEAQTRASLVSLLGRTIDTMMTTSIRQALKDADVIIDPDLVGLTGMSWRASGDLADRGYAAAEAMKDKLLPLAVDEATYEAHLQARLARKRIVPKTAEFLTVVGVDAREEAFIRETMAPLVGQPLTHAVVADRILTVTGTDRYEYLTYRPIEKDGKVGLEIRARQKPYGPPLLQISPELSNVDSSSFSVNLAGRVTAYDWVGRGSEVRIDGVIGTRQGLGFEVWRPLGRSPIFIAPRAYFARNPRNFYFEENFIAEYRFKRAGGGVDLGYAISPRAEFRVGIDAADVRGRIRVGSPGLPEVNGSEKYGSAGLIWDNQTSPVVPTRGLYLRSKLRYFFDAPEYETLVPRDDLTNPQEFWQGEIAGNWFTRVKREDRLFVTYGVGTSFGETPLVNDFSLGGPLRLSAFNNDELRAANYVMGGVGYLKRVGRLADVLGGNIYLGGWFEQGSAHDEWGDMRYRSSVSLGTVVETLFGPLYAGTAFDFDGRFRFYIGLGPLFR